MRKFLIVGALAFSVIATLTACSTSEDGKLKQATSVGEYIDQETGVHYLVYRAGNRGGITVRYNADGSLYTTK